MSNYTVSVQNRRLSYEYKAYLVLSYPIKHTEMYMTLILLKKRIVY